jgi:hypothetical protein
MKCKSNLNKISVRTYGINGKRKIGFIVDQYSLKYEFNFFPQETPPRKFQQNTWTFLWICEISPFTNLRNLSQINWGVNRNYLITVILITYRISTKSMKRFIGYVERISFLSRVIWYLLWIKIKEVLNCAIIFNGSPVYQISRQIFQCFRLLYYVTDGLAERRRERDDLNIDRFTMRRTPEVYGL